MNVILVLRQGHHWPYRKSINFALNDGGLDKSVGFHEQLLQIVDRGALDINCILWSDEAISKLNHSINQPICFLGI